MKHLFLTTDEAVFLISFFSSIVWMSAVMTSLLLTIVA